MLINWRWAGSYIAVAIPKIIGMDSEAEVFDCLKLFGQSHQGKVMSYFKLFYALRADVKAYHRAYFAEFNSKGQANVSKANYDQPDFGQFWNRAYVSLYFLSFSSSISNFKALISNLSASYSSSLRFKKMLVRTAFSVIPLGVKI